MINLLIFQVLTYYLLKILILIFMMVVIVMGNNIQHHWELDYLWKIFTLVLNLVMMVLAAFLSKLSGLGDRQHIAITLECGLQNGTLAIFVAATLIGNKTMMVPGGIYSLIMFASAIAYLFIVKRQPSKTSWS